MHKHKIPEFDHPNCSCGINGQTLKHVIMNCVLIFDTFDIWLAIENDEEKYMKNWCSISKQQKSWFSDS